MQLNYHEAINLSVAVGLPLPPGGNYLANLKHNDLFVLNTHKVNKKWGFVRRVETMVVFAVGRTSVEERRRLQQTMQ